jgi:hypothetical protein
MRGIEVFDNVGIDGRLRIGSQPATNSSAKPKKQPKTNLTNPTPPPKLLF